MWVIPADCRQGMNLWELVIKSYGSEELSLAGHSNKNLNKDLKRDPIN
jgi:hypothetical protein